MNESTTNIESIKLSIPEKTQDKWQRIVDIMARVLEVPAGLIMKVEPPYIEVFLRSHSEGNPYKKNERADLNTGLYCETVMKEKQRLLVGKALDEPEWDHNPDLKLGMTFYLGFPIQWPNGDIFGTICVLDSKNNEQARHYSDLIEQFKEVIDNDLRLIVEIEERRSAEQQLQSKKDELESFNKILVDREIVIIEMKEEVNELCRKLGITPKYEEVWKE
jgi:transcriptional regulator with GAF, ATPase, and Fis domain